MTRALSTVVDVSMALLLVSAAAVALVTIPVEDRRPPDPDATARTVLASTVDVTYQASAGERKVSGRVATVLGEAAVAKARGTDPGFVAAAKPAVAVLLAEIEGRIQVVARAGSTTLRVGQAPPPRASVASVTHPVVVDNQSATLTVRTWSP